MQKQLLFPENCRVAGWILLPFASAWIMAHYVFEHSVFPFLCLVSRSHDMLPPDFIFSKGFGADFNGELSILATLISLFMIAFSREKTEDEYIRSVRLRSLQQSIYANYLLLALASTLFYGFSYVYVLQANVFSLLLIYILVFNYHLYIQPRFSKTQAI